MTTTIPAHVKTALELERECKRIKAALGELAVKVEDERLTEAAKNDGANAVLEKAERLEAIGKMLDRASIALTAALRDLETHRAEVSR